jgi:hypothetical protein
VRVAFRAVTGDPALLRQLIEIPGLEGLSRRRVLPPEPECADAEDAG